MTRLAMLAVLLVFGGCAAQCVCEPLPDPPAKADFNKLSAYTTKVVTLYGECAGGT